MWPNKSTRWSTQYKPRVLALDMSRIFDIEYSALQALIEREERATGRGAMYGSPG
jgi:hypothetical protein